MTLGDLLNQHTVLRVPIVRAIHECHLESPTRRRRALCGLIIGDQYQCTTDRQCKYSKHNRLATIRVYTGEMKSNPALQSFPRSFRHTCHRYLWTILCIKIIINKYWLKLQTWFSLLNTCRRYCHRSSLSLMKCTDCTYKFHLIQGILACSKALLLCSFDLVQLS